MVSVTRYYVRPVKSQFEALAPPFEGSSDPEGWRVRPSWWSGGAALAGVSEAVHVSAVPLCFTCRFPNSVGRRRALLLLMGLSGETVLWLCHFEKVQVRLALFSNEGICLSL